jgi:hypothetical protein
LNVRIIRYQTDGRNEEITIITTLLDQERYPARSIAELYGYRWNCEVYQPEYMSSAHLYQLAA